MSSAGPETYDVVVIGAGWTGLISAYTYLQLAPDSKLLIVDDGGTIGGCWNREKIYPNLYAQINPPKFEYSMWPMKPEGVTKDGYIPADTIHEYLNSFAEEFKLVQRTRLNTRVLEIDRIADRRRWSITVNNGANLLCEKLIYATGPTSNPIVPRFPSDGFTSPVVHSQVIGEHLQWIEKNCRRVTVVGGAKSAFDTVYMLVKAGQHVDWLVRDSPSGVAAMAAPTVLGLWSNVDHVATRMAANFSPSIMNTSGFWYHFLQRTYIGRAITRLYWRVPTFLAEQHAGYSANEQLGKLRPHPPGAGMFWGSGGIGVASAPEFWKVLHSGDITIRKGVEIKTLSRGNVVNLQDGDSFQTDFVILCTGYDKGYMAMTPQLREECGLNYSMNDDDPSSRWRNMDTRAAALVDEKLPFLKNPPSPPCHSESKPSHGPSRHYRRLIVPGLAANGDRSILFPGQIHSVFTPLTAEVQALWGAAFMLGYLDLPSQKEMEFEAAVFNAWTRKRYLEQGKKHAYILYDFMSYIDTLMGDLGLKTKRKSNPLAEQFAPYHPGDYRGLIQEYLSVRERNNKTAS
ncbi:uncharacterized protein ATNIH1004_002103 [Aspergillus tanneri]|uniref:Uncharacterized protein n=1 Tax=Aspergillus tanneri TaxID=1220188 RepID=A0A5M9MQP0_9EURO|nr:uncharacterized protein ATNIH1004_002103 [Aspergillus tanneri]KAA8649432.1 hypothetical protein ATNIH1004_002103 [Aspergillus tanneri]